MFNLENNALVTIPTGFKKVKTTSKLSNKAILARVQAEKMKQRAKLTLNASMASSINPPQANKYVVQ